MIKHLQHLISMVVCMLVPFTMMAQEDITNQYLQNADLSTLDEGWDYGDDGFDYTAWNTSADVPVVEFYHTWGAYPGTDIGYPINFHFTQTITLPAGDYRIAVCAFYREGNGDGTNTKAYIFAGEKQQKVYGLTASEQDDVNGFSGKYIGISDLLRAANAFSKGDFSNAFDFSLPTEQEITLGFRGYIDTYCSWCILGPVKLYKYSLENYLEDYRAKVAEANALTAKMGVVEAQALNDAIVPESSFSLSSEVTAAIATLTNAIHAAKQSITDYATLEDVLARASIIKNNVANVVGDDVLAAYENAVFDVQNDFDAGSVTDFAGSIAIVEEALIPLVKYQRADNSDFTMAIVNPHINGSGGWTCERPYGGNGPLVGGDRFEYWAGNAYSREDGSFDYYQEITGLPNGYYTVSASMYNSLNDEGGNYTVFLPTSGVYATSGGNEVMALVEEESGVFHTYTTDEILVSNGRIRIGIKNAVTPMAARWFVADDFHLTLVRYVGGEDMAIPNEAIDLGLPSGTKWAPWNVGASKPEEFGGYYAWGETEEKEVYDWSTYILCDGTAETCHDIGTDIAGTEYDVAHVKWGGSWTMPTYEQFNELFENCTIEWTTLNDVKGCKLTGPNGNCIFIPAAGFRDGADFVNDGTYYDGYVWSSLIDESNLRYVHLCYFYSRFAYGNRYNGLSIRPVISYEEFGYHDGDIFTAQTTEGIEMTFKVISAANKTCQVGTGDGHAIDYYAEGPVTIPASINGYQVVEIGNNAFSWCSQITSLTIPASVNTIGLLLLRGCNSLSQIMVESGNTIYDSRNNCNAIIKSTDNELIAGCKTSTIPYGVTSIGKHAFRNCKFEAVPTFPSTLRKIDESAFYQSSGLGHLALPEGLEKLSSYAFEASDIQYLYIPASLKYIESYAFEGCSSIQQIVVSEDNPYYDSRDNCNAIILTSYNKLIRGSNTTVIPDEITSLDWSSFDDLTGLKELLIPEGVTDLGNYTFYSCTGLETIRIPSTVAYIGSVAFYDCISLKSIYCYIQEPFPLDCTYNGPFGRNSSESNLTYQQATLYVPAGTKALYEATEGWKKFQNIVEMEGEVELRLCSDNNHPHWIDLGLNSGSKMLCCNLNTSNLTELGNSYTWDEAMALAKGGNCRLLTTEEISEIVYNCEHQLTEINGVQGQLITGANGKKLFLPLGDYWSCEVNNEDDNAYYMYVKDSYIQWARTSKDEKKYIRPVVDTEEPRTQINSKEVNGTTYVLYREAVDRTDIHKNYNGWEMYRSKVTLDVTRNGTTQTYTIDDQLYVDDTSDSLIPCMMFDSESQTMWVFCVSKTEDEDYGLAGYLYSSPMDNISFHKESIFYGANFGWWPSFEGVDNGQPILNFFSFSGYYSMTVVRDSEGGCHITDETATTPDDYKAFWQEKDLMLVIDNSAETELAYQRALGTIIPNINYRISTEVDGTRYYLMEDGYLSDDELDAGSFHFQKVAGDVYEYGFKLTDVCFTNPDLDSNNEVIFHSGCINRNPSLNRDTWEAQVYFLNENGKYAIRSTNASEETVTWGPTARTFWTVYTGNGWPEAEYSNSINYIWQLEYVDQDNPEEYAKQLYTVCTKAEAMEGRIPNAAYQALAEVVDAYNQEYATIEEYISAIQTIQEAMNTHASAEMQTKYGLFKKRWQLYQQVLNTAELVEKTAGTLSAYEQKMDDASMIIEDADILSSLESMYDIAMDWMRTALLTLINNVIPSEEHPLEITALLENPDFEETAEATVGVLPGWTCTFVRGETATNIGWMPNAYNSGGVTSAVGDAYVNGDISICHFMEAWQDLSGLEAVGDGELYQRLSGLPVGKYRLTTDAIAVNQWNYDWNPVTGTFIYISSGQVETTTEIHTGNGLPEHFEVDFINDHAEYMDFGLKTENTTANWIAADNFHIYYVSELQESPGVTMLKETLVQYENVSFGPCEQGVLDDFTNELAHAVEMSETDIYSLAHSAECFDEIPILQGKYDAVLTSVATYQTYQQATDKVLNRLASMRDAASPLGEALTLLADKLQQGIDNGNAVPAEYQNINTQINDIIDYWNCHFADEDMAILRQALQQLGNQPAWEGRWNLDADQLVLDGITNTEGRVTAVSLNNRGLTGAVPSALLTLEKPTSFNLSQNCFSAFDGTIPEGKTLNIRNQQLDVVVNANICRNDALELLAQLPTILRYDSGAGGLTNHFAFSVQGETWRVNVTENNGGLQLTSWSNYIYKEAKDAVMSCTSSYGDATGTTFRLHMVFDDGDANFDGTLDVLDLQSNINYILEKYPSARPYNFTAANLWSDEIINVQDLICQINLLMETEQYNAEGQVKRQMPDVEAPATARLYMSGGQLMLNSDTPVAAFDITVTGASGITLNADLTQQGFTCSTKQTPAGLRIIGYSLSDALIPIGSVPLATIKGSATAVVSGLLADGEAEAIIVRIGGTPTDINGVGTPTSGRDEIYDLQGRKIHRYTQKGLYIQNGRKVINK